MRQAVHHGVHQGGPQLRLHHTLEAVTCESISEYQITLMLVGNTRSTSRLIIARRSDIIALAVVILLRLGGGVGSGHGGDLLDGDWLAAGVVLEQYLGQRVRPRAPIPGPPIAVTATSGLRVRV